MRRIGGLRRGQLYIEGSWADSLSGSTFESVDPSNGKTIGFVADGDERDVVIAVDAAREAFRNAAWSQNPRLRQLALLRWADRLDSARLNISQLLTSENGKPLKHAQAEMVSAISQLRYYAGLARHIPGRVMEIEPGIFSSVLREPAGVVGIITPWNAPVVLLIRSLAPALAAGCTAVVKVAPQTALTSSAVVHELDATATFPKGAVNMLSESGHEIAQGLTISEKIDVLSFTGSTKTGVRIMGAAAPTLKRLSLELGGKASCIVFEDVNVAVVAKALASAATILAGQQCTAARRIIVHASLAEEMRHALKSALKEIRIGPGQNPKTEMGPLIDESARENVENQTEEAIAASEEVVLRGGRPQGSLKSGYFLTPTLLLNPDPELSVNQPEVFGPLIFLETFETENEAIAKANNTKYGLAASIWTCKGAQALRIARALSNGTVWINDHNKLAAEAETGGYRLSGVGRLQGYDALEHFTELKHIYQDANLHY